MQLTNFCTSGLKPVRMREHLHNCFFLLYCIFRVASFICMVNVVCSLVFRKLLISTGNGGLCASSSTLMNSMLKSSRMLGSRVVKISLGLTGKSKLWCMLL